MFEKWAEKFNKTKPTEEIEFADYDTVRKVEAEKVPEPEPVVEAGLKSRPESDSNIELKVVHPESFAEVSTIADYLIEGCTVVLNLEMLDKAQTLRMLDFLNGVTYTTEGEIKKVAQSTYIITPHNVDVTDEQN